MRTSTPSASTREQTVIDQLADGSDDARQVGAEVPVEAVLDLYRQQIDLTNAIITATPIDGRTWLVLTE